jgi:hypothetical protein
MAEVTLDRDEAEQGDLPKVCMRCGSRHAGYVRRKFRWYPRILAGAPLWRMISTRRCIAYIPLCDEHVGWGWGYGPAWWGLRPTHIDAESITIAGVADEFADALEEYRRGHHYKEVAEELVGERPLRRRPRYEDEADGGSAWVVPVVLVGFLLLVVVGVGLALFTLALARPRPAGPPVFPPFPPAAAAAPAPPAAAAPAQPDPLRERPECVGVLAVVPWVPGPAGVPWAPLFLAAPQAPGMPPAQPRLPGFPN